MGKLLRDLAYAARSLRKSPAFSLTAIVTLALGIGVSTAIFSVVNAVLLRPLPYANPERLVHVWSDLRNRDQRNFPQALGDLPDLREHGTSFDGLAAVQTGRIALTGENGEAEQVVGGFVTTNLFSVLGTRIAIGRDFVEADGAPQPQPAPAAQQATAPPQGGGAAPRAGTGAPPAAAAGGGAGAQAAPPPARLPAIAILSHEFWQRRFGGDSGIVGRSIDFGNNRANIVGVLAPGFELLFPPGIAMDRTPDVFTAIRADLTQASRTNVGPRVVGRLKPGVTLDRAQAQLDGIASDLRQRFPIKQTAGFYLRAEPMHQSLVQDVRPAILALMGAVMFVLLIACANVANLLLVRGASRERELAVRAALGGSRWLLVRQVMAESLVLAGAGALLGLFLAQVAIDSLRVIAPANVPRTDSVSLDPLVVAFAAAAAFVAALVFGVLPALRASRPDVADVLRSTARTGALSGGHLVRNAVVITEVALSFVLLVGSGLMLRTFVALVHTDPGYNPQGILTFLATGLRARSVDERAAYVRQMQEKLSAIPGVKSVTASSPFPLDRGISSIRYGTEEALSDPTKFQQAYFYDVLPGYFEMLGTRLIAGRTFAAADNDTALRNIVIDKRLAAKMFGNRDPIGQRLFIRLNVNPEPWTIVGVVAHQRNKSYATDGQEALYFADGELGFGGAARWALRTKGDPAALTPLARAAVRDVNPAIAVGEVQTMSDMVSVNIAPTTFSLALIAIFAVIAAVLAAVGLYGVLSTVVRQRTAEIGVRVAFGAPRQSILQLIIGHGLRLSAVGVVIGLAAALALTRVMTTMLVGVKPTDPLTFGSIVAAFVVIAWLASWIPARRAARLDPIVALREE
jgi:putative ABC transport system permease protein